ncbi:hypothetical protein H6H01_25060 [Nostoc calcicola FACHB-3891]|nr:hypothetical protein [Nostoc calcicola FACHB-3891]
MSIENYLNEAIALRKDYERDDRTLACYPQTRHRFLIYRMKSSGAIAFKKSTCK